MAKKPQESQEVDAYDAVLADLRSKREQIDRTIQMIEGMRGGASASIQGVSAVGMASGEIRTEGPGAFLGMTVADAAVKLLGLRKTPLTNAEIVAAIVDGGVHLKSADKINTVGAILHRRSKNEGDIVRVGKQWGLSAWYPNAARFTKKQQAKKGAKTSTSEPE